MEKIERKQSVDSDQRERGFFTINSLGELLPIIFIAFFFAYIAGSQHRVDLTADRQTESSIEINKFSINEENTIEKNKRETEVKIHHNTSPLKNSAKTLPIIENKQKRQSLQEKAQTEQIEKQARPHFPKAKTRQALPKLEAIEIIEEINPRTEKYTSVEVEPIEKLVTKPDLIEEAIISTNIPLEKEKNIELLERKAIRNLAEVKMERPEMVVKADWKPREIIKEELIEEELVETIEPEIEEEVPAKLLATVNYNSSDFKWAVNNYNRGLKKSLQFINTPDGKASYYRTDAGIVLKINDLSKILNIVLMDNIIIVFAR